MLTTKKKDATPAGGGGGAVLERMTVTLLLPEGAGQQRPDWLQEAWLCALDDAGFRESLAQAAAELAGRLGLAGLVVDVEGERARAG